jgi:hypothetical protein
MHTLDERIDASSLALGARQLELVLARLLGSYLISDHEVNP